MFKEESTVLLLYNLSVTSEISNKAGGGEQNFRMKYFSWEKITTGSFFNSQMVSKDIIS